MDRLPFVVALLVMVALERAYRVAVDARPRLERDVLDELQRGQLFGYGFLGFLLVAEIARVRLHVAGTIAIALPPIFGLLASITTNWFRWSAHRLYELSADDPDDERAVRARSFQRRIAWSFALSAAVWCGVILYRVLLASR